MKFRATANSAAVALLAAFGSGCGVDGADEAQGTTLTVLAAASLTETFTDVAEQFEAQHPGVSVRLAFDSSATLAAQATQGAPADVLATADLRTMQSAVDAGVLATEPLTFATNTMTLIVPTENSAGVDGLNDLDASDLDYVTCVETAPCGATAATLLDRAGVSRDPASREVDVKAVLAKVAQDEADAGLVYRTDAMAAGDEVASVEIPGAQDEVLSYQAGALEQAQSRQLAEDFVEFLVSSDGKKTLSGAGFGPP